MAQTSPAKFRLQAVLVKYSIGFSLYVSNIKFLYAMYLQRKEWKYKTKVEPTEL